MATFKLTSVTTEKGNGLPLRAVFYDGDERVELPCDGQHLLSFAAFKRHAANNGFWLNDQSIPGAIWDGLVAHAFEVGRAAK